MSGKWIVLCVLLVALAFAAAATASAGPPGQAPEPRVNTGIQTGLGSAFTYQGQLRSGGAPITDTCNMAFRLYDAAAAGLQVGNAITATVPIADGLFTVVLNESGQFGPQAFAGDRRWLGILVRCSGDPAYADLGRQELTAAPYAHYALGAPWEGLARVPAGFADGRDGVEYRNVIVVARSGGDFGSIQAALDSIADASATNPYLIWVAPGTYTETVTMKPHVDVEGAGELLTRVTYWGSGSLDTGTVVGADHAELRALTVENTGGNTYAVAIYDHSASPRITRVTAIAAGASDGGQTYGVLNASSSPAMTDVTVTSGSQGGLEQVQSYGVYNDASSPQMTHVAATALGVVSGNGGADECYGVYNGNSSSPGMTDVTASATGTDSYGVYNDASSPVMAGVTARATGIASYGVYNRASAPDMNDVRITISGLWGYGVYNDSSTLTLNEVTIAAQPEFGDFYGIYNRADSGSYEVRVNHSRIASSLNTIHNDAEFTTLVGASLLDGGGVLANGGTVTCAGVYDENYTFGTNTCP